MLAIAGELKDAVVVPPTLKAVVAARLEGLDPGERNVLQRGAVEGAVFHRGAVAGARPGELHLTSLLARLVQRS